MKKQDYYKDIIFYVEERLGIISAMEAAERERNPQKKQLYMHMVEKMELCLAH